MPGDPASIIIPLNVPVLAPAATWPSALQPSNQSPIMRVNANQINDAVRVVLAAPYALTLNIQQSNLIGSGYTNLFTQSVAGGTPVDTGWIYPTQKYIQVQIVNGATQQGGDIYANAQQVNPAPIQAYFCLFMQEPATNNDMVNPYKQIASLPFGTFGTSGSNNTFAALTPSAKRRSYLITSTLNQSLTAVLLTPFDAMGLTTSFNGFTGEPTANRPAAIATLSAGNYTASDYYDPADSVNLAWTTGTAPTSGTLTISVQEIL